MNTVLLTPLKGWVGPLEEAPDQVFAGRMLGDGVAIDPTGSTVYAPCDGQVTSLAATLHAVTIRADSGAEILIHVGLDTVALGGVGFTAHIKPGQGVRAGDALISFDMDALSRTAKSLLTPVVIINSDAFSIGWRDQDRETEVGERLIELIPTGTGRGGLEASPDLMLHVTLGLSHGLHARPAARIAAAAKTFEASLWISAKNKRADAKSPLALMTLGAGAGEALVVTGQGRDAQNALKVLADLLGADEEGAALAASNLSAGAEPLVPEGPTTRIFRGVAAAPGRAVGPSFRFVRADIPIDVESRGAQEEQQAFASALSKVRLEITRPAQPSVAGVAKAVMEAHLALLEDPLISEGVGALIMEGQSAGVAWSRSIDRQIAALKALDDPRLQERAGDLVDLRRRVLTALAETIAAPAVPAGVILLADDLSPSELLVFGEGLKGLCTAGGGSTSHVAIIAASMGLAAVAAAGPGVLAIDDGTLVLVDGTEGLLHLGLSAEALGLELKAADQRSAARALAREAAQALCITADGVRIEIFANLAGVGETRSAVRFGAEGCGLLRSEFLFMDRSEAPSEDEQFWAYQEIADALEGRPLVVRTLDSGGDKALAYLPFAPEENPALGLRGVRASLAHPELMRTQLRAILRVQPYGACKIMVPMITSVSELIVVRDWVERACEELKIGTLPELGVMIETPAAALTAEAIAEVADFMSIGTNDLAQYALAMDRGNCALAGDVDALHPAVLRLIVLTCQGAKAHGKAVGVCGALASDPMAAPLLIGLGVTVLSAAPSGVPELKARVRGLTLEGCRTLAATALKQSSANGVRTLLARGVGGPL